ncbi:MAG: hypothetical protein ABL867_06130 [Rickettsiales bacterium]
MAFVKEEIPEEEKSTGGEMRVKNPKYTKWKVALDILSLIPFIIFIGVLVYEPGSKIRYPNGDLTLSGILFLINFFPALAGGVWLVFRYIGSDLLLFRLLDKLHVPLSIFIILMMILLSLITAKG